MLIGRVHRVAGGDALRAVSGGVTVLGGWRGVFIHRALHGRIGGQRPRLALDVAVSSMVDGVGVLQGVRQPVRHAHLLWHRVHHTLGAMKVARPLLGVALTLAEPLGLGHLHLPCLRLLQHGLPSSRGHHLEGDNWRQLLSAHGDVHWSHHLALAVAHGGMGAPHLVGDQAEHVAAVAVLGHAHPALLLSQHVADRGQDGSGGRAGQKGRRVSCGGDGAGHVSCVRVWRFQRIHG